MSLTSRLINYFFTKSDAKRDKGLTSPKDIIRRDDIQYCGDPVWNLLDVCYPTGTDRPLPAIVNIHGGGYVYGTKEAYQYYCMDLAQRGFAVVNFNYHLAPKHRFPMQLHEVNRVFEWMCDNATEYYIDLNNIFIVGESAGAHLTSQYSLMWADPDYAALFGIKVPKFRLAAIALNCGMYDAIADGPLKLILKNVFRDYYGRNIAQYSDMLNIEGRIKSNYPPSYVMSSARDFLKHKCQPMAELLLSKGVPVEWKIYGEPSDKMAGHAFHCDIRYGLATRCNDDETAFFGRYAL